MDSVAGLDFGSGGLGDLGLDLDDGSDSSDTNTLDVDNQAEKEQARTSTPYVDFPIIVLKNYDMKGIGKREEVLDAFAGWVGSLIENEVCCPLFSATLRNVCVRRFFNH